MRSSRHDPKVVVAALAFAFLALRAAPAHAAEPWPTDGGGAGSTVTVVVPDDQSATAGAPIVPFRIEAKDSDPSRILMYSATGLPSGLTMSSVIGAISGTPTEAGTWTVIVTVTDGTGPASSIFFTWNVVPGQSVPAL